MELFTLLLPEIVLTGAALMLFLFGVVKSPAGRRLAPWVALFGLIASGLIALAQSRATSGSHIDWTGSILAGPFADYVKVLTAVVGLFFVFLSWPTNDEATGNSALRFGPDAGEYFGLLLLSLAGLMLVGSANDTMLLFMGIELASIPTYVLVSMSRPLPAAQEAGVKYFYLGAMSAAVLLFGFAYLYGATGTTSLTDTGRVFAGQLQGVGYGSAADAIAHPATWKVLGVVFVLLGLAFKMAAVPLHFYAGDVYTGAATPITALLSFVPKAVGVIATLKLLHAVGGNAFALPDAVWKVLFAIAVLSMFVGNLLALLADNVKRVMAYSSIAHSGYMLVAVTALAAAGAVTGGRGDAATVTGAVAGVLFYLLAYGVMNAGVFGVLMMLPTRRRVTDAAGNVRRPPATSAETYDDIAGAARRHPLLTVAMAVCCISLIGIPLTAGFLGKLYILRPAIELAGTEGISESGRAAMWWLVGLTVLNAAIGAAYYLRIIATMVLTPSPEEEDAEADRRAYAPAPAPRQPWPLWLATALSAGGVLIFGMAVPVLDALNVRIDHASRSLIAAPREPGVPVPAPPALDRASAGPVVEPVAQAR